MTSSPFGRVLTAMVTPMSRGGEVDEKGTDSLVDHLLATGHDGIVVNGTTGESSTLTNDESIEMVRRVKQRAGDRAKVVAGVGSNDTSHAVAMARRAADAGADALLLVSPYYNRPTQPGLIAHCHAVADTTDLPVMLYDIPARTGIPFTHRHARHARRAPEHRRGQGRQGRPVGLHPRQGRDRPAVVQRRGRPQPATPRARRDRGGLGGRPRGGRAVRRDGGSGRPR